MIHATFRQVRLGMLTIAWGFGSLCIVPGSGSAQDSFADHDSSQPVEIESDNLVVRQAENLAVFSGNVDAVQGIITLEAETLTVHYRLDGNEGEDSQPIERLVAEGDVIITSPSETATGDRGIYDLLAGTMELTGNVVLTSDGNIVEGSRLNIDLNDDVATVHSEGDDTGRVRALFQPAASSPPAN